MKSPSDDPVRAKRWKTAAPKRKPPASPPTPSRAGTRRYDFMPAAENMALGDPAFIACKVMLSALLAETEEADYLTWQQVCVVLLITDGDWLAAPWTPAWYEVMRNRRGRMPRPDAADDHWRCHVATNYRNTDITSELIDGMSLAMLTTDLGLLDDSVVAAADAILRLEPPSPALVGEIIAALTKKPMIYDVPDWLGTKLTPAVIRLSYRRGQHPEDLLDRLLKIAGASGETPPMVVEKTRPEPDPTALDRVHGADEAVAWGRNLARDLAAYRAGELTWADVDRGVLVSGPPGCGKTTFAKALARECGVELVATSYGDWQSAGREGHLGELIKRLRQRFDQARKAAPCIMFIDELDSVGSRSAGTRLDDWWRSIINVLLAELDGVTGREGVVVVGASNDHTHIDPAILRSGRLDRVVFMQLPDAVAIAGIFRDHLGEAALGIDLQAIASRALGGSGADCERWARGARRRARVAGRLLNRDDLIAGIDDGLTSPSDEAQFRAAVHEAGHAVALEALEPGCVGTVTLRHSAAKLGLTRAKLRQMSSLLARDLDDIALSYLAGRAAEEVVCGEPDTGSGGDATSDLAQVTLLFLRAGLSYGLGENLLWWGAVTHDTVPQVLTRHPALADAVSERITAVYDRALDLMRERKAAVLEIARFLTERISMTGDEVRASLQSTI